MDFKRMDEHTFVIDLSPHDLLQKGFHIHEINEDTKDKILDMLLTELEEQHEFELPDALSIKILIGHFGMKVVISEVSREDFPQMMPPHFLPDFIKEAITNDNMPFSFFENEHDDEEIEPSHEYVIVFKDFEDYISMVSQIPSFYVALMTSSLYHYENKYYLVSSYNEEIDEEQAEDAISFMKEYGNLSKTTRYVLDEYGKIIMDGNAIEQTYEHFVDSNGMSFEEPAVYSIHVPYLKQHVDNFESIEVLVDERFLETNGEVYFESLSDDPDFQFGVTVNLTKKTAKGFGSRTHKLFIFEYLLPAYYDSKSLSSNEPFYVDDSELPF